MTSAMFEFMAAAFYRQTGEVAPGWPTAGFYESAERSAKWREWLRSTTGCEARERFQDDLRDAHAEWLEEASGLSFDEAREIEEDHHG